jgi:hypothetical protein
MGRGRGRPRQNLVFLGTDSRDSELKLRACARAARALGFRSQKQPDAWTAGIFPLSDFRALDAAWMCKSHGIAGPDPIAVCVAASKSLTYQFLRNRGFELLRWLVPVRQADLHAPLRGPVIVKPDSGSGSYSQQPWGYRVFDSLRDFRRYLHAGKLTDRFLETQVLVRDQRHVVMDYVETPQVQSIATVVRAGRPLLYDTSSITELPGAKVVGRILIGERHPDTARVVKMAEALAAAGLRRSVIYFQCVERRGRLYPIDCNLRPGAVWGRGAVALKVPVYEELLAVMLGLKRAPAIRWPAPYVGIARVPLAPRKGRFRYEFADPDAIAVNAETRYDPSRPYDVGQAWPMFALACAQREEFDRRADAVSASTRLVRRYQS